MGHLLHTGLFGKLLLFWTNHLRRDNVLERKDHLRVGAASSVAQHRGSVNPTQWPGPGLCHVLHDGRWHRGWRHSPCSRPHLSWQLLKLPKPRLRWPRMRQHHWLPGHGLLQHKAWLHRLHRLHHLLMIERVEEEAPQSKLTGLIFKCGKALASTCRSHDISCLAFWLTPLPFHPFPKSRKKKTLLRDCNILQL